MTSLLDLEQVSKKYGSTAVVDRLDLSVGRHEALGIIGPNGAGKTTMFNLIAGDVMPDDGRVIYDGRDITGLPPYRRCRMGIGRSYQIPHPFARNEFSWEHAASGFEGFRFRVFRALVNLPVQFIPTP